MTTAYTSLLGLALPVTGELSGTWGDTVNNSITSLLDTSVAGTTNVSTDTDVTLTTTTGAANTARQAILLFSGARTALRTVTAPAQSKIYTVINATTGGFSVKLVGAGPTTGVTIVAGESAVCAWNGSDFIKISNTGGSASFTNVTVTGTTTLSGLTASTALALDASKNVVSVTNTGTGNNVLSASPTLTGTISAAAITASGTATLNGAVVIFNSATNTLSLQKGDGAASILFGSNTAANGQITSVASGGLFFSTGDITQTEKMRITATGDVGIGTSSPSAKLQVNVTSTTDQIALFAGQNANNYIAIYDGSGTNATFGSLGGGNAYMFASTGKYAAFYANSAEGMRLNSTGLGIGTTSPNYVATLYKASLPVLQLANSTSGSTASDGLLIYLNGANATISNEEAGALNFQTSATLRATLDASGNLGLGTSSPSSILHLYASAPLISATSTNNVSGLRFNVEGTTTGYTYRFQYQGTSYATIDASGNVGIATDAPTQKLDVFGSAAITGATPLYLQRPVIPSFAGQGAPSLEWRFYTTGTTYTTGAYIQALADGAWTSTSAPTSLRFYTVPSGSTTPIETMRTDTNGMFLDTGSGGGRMTFSPGATRNQILSTTTSFAAYNILRNQASSYEWLNASSTQTMTLDVNGNLGIGRTSPSAKLDVGGTSAKLTNNDSADVTVQIGPDTPSATRSGRIGFITSSAQKNWYIANNWLTFGGLEFTQTTTAGGSTMSGTPSMLLDPSGNLLLGTTTAGGRLTVATTTAVDATLTLKAEAANYASIINIEAQNDNGAIYNYIASNTTSVTQHWKISGGAATNTMAFSTGGSERARFNSTGAMVFAGGTTTADGIGITFPATQNASSNANTLDDYEEGTWTPTLTFGGGSTGITYTTQTGTYVKVGRFVTITVYIYTSSKGSSTGVMGISGLPFGSSGTSPNYMDYYFPFGARQGFNLSSGLQPFVYLSNTVVTTLDFYYTDIVNGGSPTPLQNTAMNSVLEISLQFTYRTAN